MAKGPSPNQKTVLITGASAGGIGSALAESFASRGMHVFATVRTPSKAAHLALNPNITVLSLEVTDAASIAACVESVRELVSRSSSRRLDYLVNNSGAGYVCPVVDIDTKQARDMFDVNFWASSTSRAPLCRCSMRPKTEAIW